MGGFLGELGKKLAERWLSLLVLPGALYLAVFIVARTLGHRHALDVHRLTGRVTAWAKAPSAVTTGGQLVLLAAALAGAAGVGLAAQGLGSAAERLALAADWRTWPRPLRLLAQRRVERRRARWDAEHARYHRLYAEAEQALKQTGTRLDPADRHAAYQAWTRIGLERPDRPTWSGDRVNAAATRLRRDLNLDLPTVWPNLWLHLPETARTEVTAARAALARATTLAGWAVLYAPLVWWWWPASGTPPQ
ncbi:hypothetical protein AB0L00_23245 [Actinoallomurus sp. NPDC052308]|uniref:hypothetical protein n=1 Tax=Actinoallomurus sp. NPDC052308 TaxID=3155530 RepID=UPI0034169327